jgi:uncharacterized repeat protein (TIGR01451 family)
MAIMLFTSLAAVSAQTPGVTVTTDANPPFALPGDAVTYTFTVTNPNAVPTTNIIVVDSIPVESEILSVTSTSGAAIINGQAVIFQKDVMQPNESVMVAVQTRIRPQTPVPFFITNQACVEGSGRVCASVNVLSIRVLPTTGEAPLWSHLLRQGILIAVALIFLTILSGFISLFNRKPRRRKIRRHYSRYYY